jgi:hypothetical protein
MMDKQDLEELLGQVLAEVDTVAEDRVVEVHTAAGMPAVVVETVVVGTVTEFVEVGTQAVVVQVV